jgi:flagellar hook-associated protein 3 FlgL
MSGSITMTGVSGNATLSRLIQDSAATRHRLDTLTNQVSTGLVADNYAGLGSGAPVSLALHPQIANMQTCQNNVDVATGRMSVAQTALSGIQSIAASFYAQLAAVQGVNASAVDSIAASARDALGQVASALNTQDGGVYVFGGQDTANPPVSDAGNITASGVGTFFGDIQQAVSNLGKPDSAATVAGNTFRIASFGGTSPFSTYLSTVPQPALPTVQVGQNQAEPVGISASANGLIPTSPPGPPPIPGGPAASTGSYMRDVMRALATIGSLTSAQASDPGFASLVQDTRISLTGGIAAMAQDAGVLGNVQSSLTATQSRLGDTQVALTGQVSSAEEVDMASTLSRLSQVQTQMQASYQLIASLNSLSLVKYLPAG